jgi:hypothetical protein
METNLNREQSLEIINEMICRAKNNFQRGHLAIMLFWGYLISLTAIANVALLHILNSPNQSYTVWWAVIPGLLISFFMGRRMDRKAIVKTHIDRIMTVVWYGFSISVFIFFAMIYLVAFKLGDYRILSLITPVILIMLGISLFSCACICRYKLWYFSGTLFWLGAVICAIVPPDFQFLVMACCMIAGFIVPGHLLNRQKEVNV